MQSLFADDIHLAAQQCREIQVKANPAPRRDARIIPGYQQINVAVWPGLATRHRTEHAHVVRAVLFGEAQDFSTFGADDFPNSLPGSDGHRATPDAL